jgi:GT2 family glycosyltransferase
MKRMDMEINCQKPIQALPKITVIILNAFQKDDLQECLDSLQQTDYEDFDVIVVDCLTQGIEELIETKYPGIEIIHLEEDVGPSEMHNVGIRNANPKTSYYVFLDNDTIVERSWLKELVTCAESNPDIGIVQSKVLLHGTDGILNTKGNQANFLAMGWPEGYNLPDNHDSEIQDISFPCGCAMLLRKEAVEEVGLFDPDYFIYADDMDIGFRIRLVGYRIVSCPKSRVYHKYRFMKSRRNFYFLTRNRLYTLLKMYKGKTYSLIAPAILLNELAVISYGLKSGYGREVLKAYGYFISKVSEIRQKRAKIRDYRRITDKTLIEELRGGIYFSPVSDNPLVKAFLNPILEAYRRFLLSMIRW